MARRCDRWVGTTTELYSEGGVEDVSLNAYGKYLAQHRGFMLDEGIDFKRRHTRNGNVVSLIFVEELDNAAQ